jgi:hypothetical protein
MPGFVPIVGDYIQMRTCQYTPRQVALNITTWRVGTVAGGGLDLNQIAGAMDGLFAPVYKPMMPPTASWRGVGIRNLTPLMTVEFPSTGFDGVGTAGGGLSGTQVSWLISLRTPLAGRRNRGRIYPGFPSALFFAGDGSMTGPAAILIANLASVYGPNILLTVGARATSLDLQVRHPDTAIPIPFTPIGTGVISVNPVTRWATQRRRGEEGRENIPPF